MAAAVIPLFPLSVVVFPGQSMPLHIFEARYRQLIADCRDAQRRGEDFPIGISYGEDGAVHGNVGCTVVLDQVLNEYDDGRLDIMARGRDRYRIFEIRDEKVYLTAAVEYFEDDEEIADADLLQRVRERFDRFAALVESDSGARLPLSGTPGSFAFAHAASLPLAIRQELLASTSENERLQRLDEELTRLLPVLERRVGQRRKVRSNGHTHRD